MKSQAIFSTPQALPLRHLSLAAMLMVAVIPSAQANSYVGSTTCAECHQDKIDLLAQSIHSKMIRTKANAQDAGVIHGDLTKPNAPVSTNVDWVMGGWYKEESYIRLKASRPGDANTPYNYTVTQFQWDPIKGTYVNNQSLRDWTVQCAGCHTTGYQPATKTWNELNIGCEACHGPGGDHAASEDPSLIVIDSTTEACGRCHIRAESAAMPGFAAKAFNFPIGYVAGQPSTLQFIPEPLGAAASFFPDGTSNRHREQYLDMNYPGRTPTKHYENGVACTKCHNPHTAGTLTSYAGSLPAGKYGIKIYNNVAHTSSSVAWEAGDNLWNPTTHATISKENLCKTCHATVSDHHVHQFNAAASAATVTCVDCHMPDVINVDPTTLRGALAPHRFTAMMPENSMKYGPTVQPNSCTYRCHQNTGTDIASRAKWADSILTTRLTPLVSGTHPFKLQAVGTPNYKYILQASSDLTTWLPVGTPYTATLLPNNTPRWGFEYTDTNSAVTPRRFYRLQKQGSAP